MSKKATVKVIKGPQFEYVEKKAYGYLHKVLSEMAHEEMASDQVDEKAAENQKR